MIIMKRIFKYMIIGFGVLYFTSCQEHNLVEDLAQIGFRGGNAYFELPSTNVVAGDSADFIAQYWSEDDRFEELGIYYDVKKYMRFGLTYAANGYTLTFDSVEVSREFQKVVDIQHAQNSYSSQFKAYVVEGKIPVSYTLFSILTENPYSFSATEYEANFPTDFKMRFLKGLYPTLSREDLKSLYVVKYKLVDLETFDGYYDLVFDENSGKDVFVLKEEFKQTMFDHLVAIPFDQLIYNSAKQYYGIYYNRYFKLSAKFKVVNGEGVEVLTEPKEITVL